MQSKLKTMNDKELEDYLETHFEMVRHILETEDVKGTPSYEVSEVNGFGGLYQLAKEWTDEFQNKYKDTVWGAELDFNDTLEEFLKSK